MVDRRHRELAQEEIKKIADLYQIWRGEPIEGQKKYRDILGLSTRVCRIRLLVTIKK
jgi:type I restriction enzyme M protein